MKIGLFSDTYYPQINGVSTSVQQLADELIKHGHEVYIITSSDLKKTTREDNIIRLPGFKIKKLYGYNLSGFYSYLASSYLKKLNLDIVHAHSEYGIGIYARIVAKAFDIPLIYTYHTMWEDYTHYITQVTRGHFESSLKKFIVVFSKIFADNSSELIVPSLKTKKAMIRYGVTNKINVIPTGLDISKFNASQFEPEEILELRKEYGLKEDDFVAVYVGRIALEKNIDEIIKAFTIIKDRKIDNIKLVIIGSGPYYEELQEYIKQEKLLDYIQLLGVIEHEKIPTYYQLANIFVSASTSETQGLTYLEAMASHLPVLCYFDYNLEEIIEDNVNGFFVDNYSDFADKLVEISKLNKREYNEIANAAKEEANYFSSSNFYEKVINVYDNAIKSKRRKDNIDK